MAPVHVHGRWSCYAIDFESRVLSIMDPSMAMMSTTEFSLHLNNACVIIKECVRCMSMFTSDSTLGVGQWRTLVLVPRNLETSVNAS